MYPKQLAAVFCPARFSVIEASTKSGKAEHVDALVYTPSGPRRIGDIKVGDEVFAVDGSVTIVTGVFPQGVQPLFDVRFKDDAVVRCTDDHLWEVDAVQKDRPGWPRVLRTSDLRNRSKAVLQRTWVPMQGIASYADQPVPVKPYLLGVLISEGALSGASARISSADVHVLERVAAELPDGHELRQLSQYDWMISAGSGAAALREAGTHLAGILRRLGLMGKRADEKGIPSLYRYNSEAVRLEVLRGILDGDGSVDHAGQPTLEQTSEQLAKDVTEVVESLGGLARTSTKIGKYRNADGEIIECRTVYRTRIRFADAAMLFSLPEKVARCRPKRRDVKRCFRSITPAGEGEAVCIRIAHPRALYLTDRHVPTHNTHACATWLTELWMAPEMEAPPAWYSPKEDANFWWVAPVLAQSKMVMRRIKRGLPAGLYEENKQELTLTNVHNGNVLWFKGGDNPDLLYGEDVSGAVLDEYTRVKESAWHAVRSTLTATRGPARLIGNVKGRKNWGYRIARAAQAGRQHWEYHKITAYDAIMAGVLHEDDIDEARTSLPHEVFRELYMAEATEDGANPFGIREINACVMDKDGGEPVAWGWDLGRKIDWTVGVGLDQQGHLVRFYRFKRDWPDTIRFIKHVTGDEAVACIDATGIGDPVVQLIQQTNNNFIPFIFNTRSRQDLLQALAMSIANAVISYPRIESLIGELESFEYQHTRMGVRFAVPEGMHDDTAMSLALAVRALRDPSYAPLEAW